MLSRITSSLCRHVLACGALLLFGVTSNVAVIWIHTRKNSRVPRDENALIFAGINLFALVTSLPMLPLIYTHVDLGLSAIQGFRISTLFSYCFQFSINCYLVVLLMATFLKFGEVMFPCKFCSADGTPFYFKVAFTSILAVALGSMLTYGNAHLLKTKSYFDAFGMFHTIFTAALVIFCAFIHAKRQCSWRNIRR